MNDNIADNIADRKYAEEYYELQHILNEYDSLEKKIKILKTKLNQNLNLIYL